MIYNGLLYRALNPLYATDPLSGSGAQLFGGRFNARGTPALYTSLTPKTAIRESNQVGTLQPTMLVSYQANLVAVFDTRDAAGLARYDTTPATIEDPSWRDLMRRDGRSSTQILAVQLVEDGYDGLLVRSFAKGATSADLNLVIWTWRPSSLRIIDDEHRLSYRKP